MTYNSFPKFKTVLQFITDTNLYAIKNLRFIKKRFRQSKKAFGQQPVKTLFFVFVNSVGVTLKPPCAEGRIAKNKGYINKLLKYN